MKLRGCAARACGMTRFWRMQRTQLAHDLVDRIPKICHHSLVDNDEGGAPLVPFGTSRFGRPLHRKIARLRGAGSGKRSKDEETQGGGEPSSLLSALVAVSKPSPHPFILPAGRFAGYFDKTIARQGGIEISTNRICPEIEFAARP